MKTTLVVMAAGMGSRFGGLKQMQPITEDGKVILDFSVYDAVKAGFDRVIFIVREEMLEDFKILIGNRIAKSIEVDYVLQDSSILPEGRRKPFGTGHAVLCCKDNADDYYGANAFYEIRNHLLNAKRGEYAMMAYELQNTLSENGTVSRGKCCVKNGYLESVEEVKTIYLDGSYESKQGLKKMPLDTLVSMNLWGLTPDIFEILELKFSSFMQSADLSKDEFYIPMIISEAINEALASVKVYQCKDKWYGITYREDLNEIKKAIGGYIDNGLYKGI